MGLSPDLVFTVLGQRPTDAGGVATFVEAAVAAAEPVGSAARGAFRDDVSMTESVASRVWTKASGEESPDWAGVLAGLGTLAEVAERYGLTALAVSAGRTRAVVLHEEVGDRAAAEAVLNAAAEQLGDPPRLREYRGKILRTSGEFSEALAFYEELLPTWREDDPNTSRLYAYHDVIGAAGAVGEWERAAFWATEAERDAARLTAVADEFVELCYAVDGAFAAFKADRPCDAIGALRRVVNRLPDPSDPRVRMLHRRVAYVVAWIQGEVGGLQVTGIAEPPPGMASQFGSEPEELGGQDVPVIERLALLSALAQSRVLAGCGTVVEDQGVGKGESLLVRSVQTHHRLMDGIRTAAPDLLDRHVEMISTAEQASAEEEGRPPVSKSPDLAGVLATLTYGAVALIGCDPVQPDVLEVWFRRLADLFGTRDETERWRHIVGIAVTATEGRPGAAAELTLTFRDETAHVDHRIIAASALSKASRDPQTRGQALAVLTSSVAQHPLGMGVGGALANLAGVDAPPGRGVREAARSVLARTDIDTLKLSPELVAHLRKVAEEGPQWMPRSSP